MHLLWVREEPRSYHLCFFHCNAWIIFLYVPTLQLQLSIHFLQVFPHLWWPYGIFRVGFCSFLSFLRGFHFSQSPWMSAVFREDLLRQKIFIFQPTRFIGISYWNFSGLSQDLALFVSWRFNQVRNIFIYFE